MAGSDPATSGGSDAPAAPTATAAAETQTIGRTEDDTSLQQPHGAVELKAIPEPSSSPAPADKEGDSGPQTPAKDTTADNAATATSEKAAAAAAAAEEADHTLPKGKERESGTAAPPATTITTRSRSDSLSIDAGEGPAGSTTIAGTSAAETAAGDGSPVCTITLLLPTGARHPYRIDEKYLTKRSVEVPELTPDGKKDPFSISIYKLKELILREWREEWDGKPASPSSIRLIHFGKLLEDKEQLKKYQFSAEAPNVVHMSVRPAEMMDEDEAAKGKSGARDGRNREGGGGCCIIL